MEKGCHKILSYYDKLTKAYINNLFIFLFIISCIEISGGKIFTRVIHTRYGKIQGFIKPFGQRQLKPIELYLGIPYATPPTGINRFSPTRTPSPWSGVRIADSFSLPCPQKLPVTMNESIDSIPMERAYFIKQFLPFLRNYSEDCLYLNVYAPMQDSTSDIIQKYPVIVFIHGGSYSWNSGNIYNGGILASYADAVVITLNYRLGILGFLNANKEPHRSARVANYGLMDQIAALHWIQQNIALFGGDPGNVTLLGQGTGAACIHFLLTSPTVMPGLFHRAVLLSGSALSSWSLVEDPSYWAVRLAREVNCPVPEDLQSHHEDIIDCLRDVSLDILMNVDLKPPVHLNVFGPSVDGVVIKSSIRKEFLTEHDVHSSTRNLESVLNPYDIIFSISTNEALKLFSIFDIHNGFDQERRDRILRTYVHNAYSYHLSEIFYTIANEYTDWDRTLLDTVHTAYDTATALSDALYNAPVIQAGDLLSAPLLPSGQPSPTGVNSYFCVFDYQPREGDKLQNYLGLQNEILTYIFGAPLEDSMPPFRTNFTKYDLSLSESLMLYIRNFARTGNPNTFEKTESVLPISKERNKYRSFLWEEYDTSHQKYLEISQRPRIKNHYRAHQMAVWLRLVPELHRTGIHNVNSRHNQFHTYNNENIFEGNIRLDTAATKVLEKEDINGTVAEIIFPITTSDTLTTNCVNMEMSVSVHNTTDPFINYEVVGYTAYSTALSATIAIGCSLLVLNILIFAKVYRQQREKSRDDAKIAKSRSSSYEEIKHFPSGSVIVDIDRDVLLTGGSPQLKTSSSQHSLHKLPCHHVLHSNILHQQIPSTLPRNITSNTLTKEQSALPQPPNGSVTLHMSLPRCNNTFKRTDKKSVYMDHPPLTQPLTAGPTHIPTAAMSDLGV